MGKKFCSECGEELKQSAKFCPGCGNKIEKEVSNNKNNISKIPEGIPSNENKISKIKEEISNKNKNLNQKQKVIIGIAVLIIAVGLIFVVFNDSPSHVHDVNIYKHGKVYSIDFSSDIDYDYAIVNLIKDGETLYSTKGTLGQSTYGSGVTVELVKDVEIDEIRVTLFDNDYKVLDSGIIKNFEIN